MSSCELCPVHCSHLRRQGTCAKLPQRSADCMRGVAFENVGGNVYMYSTSESVTSNIVILTV